MGYGEGNSSEGEGAKEQETRGLQPEGTLWRQTPGATKRGGMRMLREQGLLLGGRKPCRDRLAASQQMQLGHAARGHQGDGASQHADALDA